MVSVGVSKEERRAAGDLLMVDIRNYPEVIEGALEDLSVDHAGASAVSYLVVVSVGPFLQFSNMRISGCNIW